MTNSLLNIQDLSIKFQSGDSEHLAVNKLSLSLNKGDSLGIVGESGSGKSVTSLSVMRLLDSKAQISGKISFNDQGKELDLLGLDEKALCELRGNKIAMVFQEPMTSLNPVYTCGNQVAEAIIKHQNCSKTSAKAKTLELFEKVLLPDPERMWSSYPHQLSGGQKQRVMIAMAISCSPDLLIADEPTTALDVTVQKEILALLASLQKELNMALIFISHDLAVVSQVCKNVAVLLKGDLVEYGEAEEIFSKPKHAYTKGLLACRPPVDRYYKKLPTVSDFTAVEQKDVASFLKSLEEPKPDFKSEAKPILEVKNLSTVYPGKKNFFGKPTSYLTAVDQVSFNLYPGEVLGLVGESGCGKSTLGRSIIRLQDADAGEVLYNGENLLSLSAGQMRKRRKDIQIIFQDPYSSLNPRMTVGKAIEEPLAVHNILSRKDRKQKVLGLLQQVGLEPEHYNRYPHEFSGGQRQRVGIARALALEPKLIICDESVSALDVSVQAQVLNLLNELKERYGLSLIFISHDLSVVKYMSDRIMVMQKGKIVEEGKPNEIYRNPKEQYTATLIESIPSNRFKT